MRYPFTASDTSISIFFAGKMHSVPSTSAQFAPLLEHLKLEDHDADVIENLIDKPALVGRLTAGSVTVQGNTVYYKGTPVRNRLAEKLVDMLDSGFAASGWANFLDNMMQNPSDRSRECLYNFLEGFNTPFTEDGCFIAFKRVRHNYFDIHSGTMDNSPGKIVEMPREAVNADPNQTCSSGLHVCATSYLGSFYAHDESSRVVAVKVNPMDVVAVPNDYSFAKMRCCRYEVIGDAEESFYDNAEASPVYGDHQSLSDAYEDGSLDHGEEVHIFDEDDAEDAGYIDGWDEEDDAWDLENDFGAEDFDDEEEDEDEGEDTHLTFERGNAIYTAQELLDGIADYGSQRAFSRATGIPRSTLQGWLAAIEAANE